MHMMNKLSKKLILALILALSFLQLSFAFMMNMHTDSMKNCALDTECIFESYVDGTDAVLLAPLLLVVPVLCLFLLAKASVSRVSFAYVAPPVHTRRFLKGTVQRE